MSKELIRLRDCTMAFDDEVVLDNINLYINDKEFLTLLGPSGCGKTTTLRIIGGFQTPTSGDVLFDGVRINAVPPHKRAINTVFQKYALFPHLNVYENIAFGLRIPKAGPDGKKTKLPEEEIEARVMEMLESDSEDVFDQLAGLSVEELRDMLELEIKDIPIGKSAAVQAAKAHKAAHAPHSCPGSAPKTMHVCPGSMAKALHPADAAGESTAPTMAPSQLRQWPVQIRLVPINAPYFDGAKLLIAADCTAYAYAAFHERFIRGHITLVGCPKLDDVDYSEKLTAIIRSNDIQEVTVVRMEVPCCGGLENAAKRALQASGKFIPWQVVTISTDGRILD